MNKKYKFTGETKNHEGITLHRIQALRSFGNVKKRELGGWIEKEENLSHYGHAWVYENAQVFGKAQVYGKARVSGDAWVYDEVWVYDEAWVYGHARVSGEARLSGNARVCGDTKPSSDTLPEELNTLPESIEEMTIKGVKYRKVTEWKKA